LRSYRIKVAAELIAALIAPHASEAFDVRGCFECAGKYRVEQHRERRIN
jgi:hypothetical protein